VSRAAYHALDVVILVVVCAFIMWAFWSST